MAGAGKIEVRCWEGLPKAGALGPVQSTLCFSTRAVAWLQVQVSTADPGRHARNSQKWASYFQSELEN